MGWILFDQRITEDDFFLITGKALFLCQHFESTCKDIVMWLCLTNSLKEQEFDFLSDKHKDYVDKLLNLFLGSSIERLKVKIPNIASTEEFQTLKEAKDSRNFICHECALDLIYASYGSAYNFKLNSDLLRQHVIKLAMGDYIVSRWSYEFHEKNSGAFKDREQYLSTIKSWVLGA